MYNVGKLLQYDSSDTFDEPDRVPVALVAITESLDRDAARSSNSV